MMGKYDQEIANIVALHGTVSIADLAVMLNVTDQTIRRIIKPLVDQGRIEKLHGAIRAVGNPLTAPFAERMEQNRSAKARIAERIAQMIPDGASLAIDTGSTAAFVAQALQRRKELTVVTNSAYIASTLALIRGNRVFMAGTQLRDYDGASFDRTAFEVIERMRVDFAVLTAGQVHPGRGIEVAEQCEMDIAIAMSRIAARSLFAIDSSKFMAVASGDGLTLPRFERCPTIVTDLTDDRTIAAMQDDFDFVIAGD